MYINYYLSTSSLCYLNNVFINYYYYYLLSDDKRYMGPKPET